MKVAVHEGTPLDEQLVRAMVWQGNTMSSRMAVMAVVLKEAGMIDGSKYCIAKRTVVVWNS